MSREVRLATSDDEIRAGFPVMAQLRPHYDETEFVVRVRLQLEQGYCLALLWEDGVVVAVAGYRIGDNLAWGRYMYVDDLVTDGARRSAGNGGALMDWLRSRAREAGCDELHLDSGVQRFAAHRFYLTQRMNITSHHFVEQL